MRSLLSGSTRLAAGLQHHFAWLPLLLARGIVGWIFVQSGLAKLANPQRLEQFFRDAGVPAAELFARGEAGMELVCGALLLAGLATRVAALPLLGVLGVALATAPPGRFRSLAELFSIPELLWAALLVGLVVLGAGRLSLDALVWPAPTRSASKLL